jgi:hypothetical protein
MAAHRRTTSSVALDFACRVYVGVPIVTFLRLPYFPPVELTVVRSVGRVLVGGLRWALPPPG